MNRLDIFHEHIDRVPEVPRDADTLQHFLYDLTPTPYTVTRFMDEVLRYEVRNGGESLAREDYVKDGDAFVKEFPLPFPYGNEIARNFERLAPDYVSAIERPTIDWAQGLLTFDKIAHEAGLDWWTTGQPMLALRGHDVSINDLDFYFREEDLSRVYDAFHEYIIEPIVTSKGTWREHSFKYVGQAYAHCPICLFVGVLADYDDPSPTHFGAYAQAHLEEIEWNGITVKTPPVALFANQLDRWGRHDDAEKVRTLCP